MRGLAKAFACVLIAVLLLSNGSAEIEPDPHAWPRWRGPNGNGVVVGAEFDPDSLNGDLDIRWQIDIGYGHSGVVVSNSRAYTLGTRKEISEVLCVDANSGKIVWRFPLGKRREGVQSTPALDGQYVYALSDTGLLVCLEARRGKPVWQVHLVDELGGPEAHRGYAASPVIVDELLILNSGVAGLGLNKHTGDLVWRGEPKEEIVGDTKSRYFATPVVYDSPIGKQVVLFNTQGVHSLDAGSGTVSWFYPWDTSGAPPVADPLFFEQKLFVSTSELNPVGALLDISQSEPRKLWASPDLGTHVSTSVYLDGHIYGIHGDYNTHIRKCSLRCIDAASGELMWQSDEMIGGSIAAVNGMLIVLNASGTVRVVEATPDAYIEVAARVLPQTTGSHRWWTSPAIHGSEAYFRNFMGDLVSVHLKG
jgi:outer membrane protein assembly factor BamB